MYVQCSAMYSLGATQKEFSENERMRFGLFGKHFFLKMIITLNNDEIISSF